MLFVKIKEKNILHLYQLTISASVIFAALGLIHCIPGLELSGKKCPCIDGWECRNDVCVPKSGASNTNDPNQQGTTQSGMDCISSTECQKDGSCFPVYAPAKTPCQDDGNQCTQDICDDAGNCTHPPVTTQLDCDSAQEEDWGDCTSSHICSVQGVQTRKINKYLCQDGKCLPATSTETRPCNRSTEGIPCGSCKQCQEGKCLAAAEGTACGNGNHCCGENCVSLDTDDNCGICGVKCGEGGFCETKKGATSCNCNTGGISYCKQVLQSDNAGCLLMENICGCQCNCLPPCTCAGSCPGKAICNYEGVGFGYCSYTQTSN